MCFSNKSYNFQAFFEILLTTGAISVTGWYFYQINQVAGLLFVPYQVVLIDVDPINKI